MDFIKDIQADVLEVTQHTRLKPSIVIAQAILESNWGKSELASVYNNYFGIKADPSWDGRAVSFNTQEYLNGNYSTIVDQFRVYPSRYASIKGHTEFLKENKRYTNVFKADTAQQQAEELQRAGYATAPNYASTLKNIIATYNLERIDKKSNNMKNLNIILAVLGLVSAVIYVIKIYTQTSVK